LFYRKQEICRSYGDPSTEPEIGKYKSNVFVELKRSTKLMRKVSVIKSNMDRGGNTFHEMGPINGIVPMGPGTPNVFKR